jgi:hypothetical protein
MTQAAYADDRTRSETSCQLPGVMPAHRGVIKRATLEEHQLKEDGVSSRLKSMSITPMDSAELIKQAQGPIPRWIREKGKGRTYRSSPCPEEDYRG